MFDASQPGAPLALDGVWLTLPSAAGPVEILRGLDFSIEAGERVAVVGPSGSGKSTLIAVGAGLERPSKGQVRLLGQELSRLVGCSREMAGRVLKVLEEQGLLRATGKTIVVFNARPKMKTRPVIVPAKPGTRY